MGARQATSFHVVAPGGPHFDGKHIQPIEEILAEGPIRYCGVQVAVRGSDNSSVDKDRMPSSHWLEFPFV
jgi:hypothetical protein